MKAPAKKSQAVMKGKKATDRQTDQSEADGAQTQSDSGEEEDGTAAAKQQHQNKKKKRRFRIVTTMIRKMRRAQRDTALSVRRKPFAYLVRSIASELTTREVFMRPSAMELLQQAVEASITAIMQDAVERRSLSMTPKEREKQHTFQVATRHLVSAYKTWAGNRPQAEAIDCLSSSISVRLAEAKYTKRSPDEVKVGLLQNL